MSKEKLFMSIFTVFINFLVAVAFLFNMPLFIMTWIEKFGQICTNYTTFNIMSHVEKCLHLFNALQNRLGIKWASMMIHNFIQDKFELLKPLVIIISFLTMINIMAPTSSIAIFLLHYLFKVYVLLSSARVRPGTNERAVTWPSLTIVIEQKGA